MSEPTLNLQLKDIQAKLGTFAGWGRGALFSDTAWDTRQQALIDDATQSGLRRFYYPEPLEGESTGHDWSFLHPTASLAFAEGASTVQMPDDFGGFEGPITIQTSSTNSAPYRIEWRNEGNLRQLYSALPAQQGPPQYAAEVPIKGTGPTQSQRFQVLIFPLADMDYTLLVQYYLNPDYLTTAFPYALGGPQHAETILESCLAAMESRLDDSLSVHREEFISRLAASVAADRKNKPQKTGYNGDRSDDYGNIRTWWHEYPPLATYNGGSFQ